MLAPGRVVERYVLLAPLGSGGMADVWLARHTLLGTRHALKVLHSRDPGLLERLVREGQLQSGLGHPGVVRVTDVVDVDGAPGLVLEYVEGPSLDVALRGWRFGVGALDALGRDVLDAVAAAHARGWVHRDLKPANVLLDLRYDRARPRVADFGLAIGEVDAVAPGQRATRMGAAMGTPAYMAPEQIRDASSVDPRADVFSLGALLYEVAVGHRPFRGANTFGILEAVAAGRREPVAALAPELPARMRDAIERALSVDPADRFADAAEMRLAWVLGGPDDPGGDLVSAPLRALWSPPSEDPRAPAASPPRLSPTSEVATASWSGAPPGSDTLPMTLGAPRPEAPPAAPVPSAPPAPAPGPPPRRRSRAWLAAAMGGVASAALGWGWLTAGSNGEERVTRVWLVGETLVTGPPAPEGYASEAVLVTRERGEITRVRGVNAAGGTLAVWDGDVGELVVARGPDGQVVGYEGLDESGNLVHRVAVERGADGVVTLRHQDALGQPAPAPWSVATQAYLGPSGVEVERVERPAPDKVRLRFEAATGSPRATTDGAFGAELTLDEAGRVASWEVLGVDGRPGVDAHGVARFRYPRGEADGPGALGQVRHEDALGAPIAGAQGWAWVELAFDAEGDVAERRFFGPSGAPTWGDFGCHALRLRIEPEVFERTCLDGAGEPQLSAERWATQRIERDEHGYPRWIRTFGVDGAPVASQGLAVAWEERYTPEGLQVQWGPWWGADGTQVPSPDGPFYVRVATVDERGSRTSLSTLDADGNLVAGPNGVATIRSVVDPRLGNLEERAFDVEGRPTPFQGAVVRYVYRYGDHGKLAEEVHFGAHGDLAADADGIARETFERDAGGQLIARRVYGPDGAPRVQSGKDWAYQVETWDAAGHLIGLAWHGLDDAPGLGPNGCEREVFTVDAVGWRLRTRCEAASGAPMVSAAGFVEVATTFDAAGHETSRVFTGLDGELVDGCSREVEEYDARGRRTYLRCFDARGEPTPIAPGTRTTTWRFAYDERDRTVLAEFLGPSGERVVDHDRGYAAAWNRYLGSSDVASEEWYEDPEGRPMVSPSAGYASARVAFDELDRRVREEYRDAAGALVVVPAYGYARRDFELDAAGRITRAVLRGVDGELFPPPAGTIVEYTYDAFGREDVVAWFDAKGRPTHGPGGHHQSRCVRGTSGDCLEWVRTRVDGTVLPPE